MLKRNEQPQFATAVCMFISSCLALMLALFFFPLNASAHTTISASGGPTFRINAGFDSRYRDGSWVPIQIALRNDGPDFNGKVSINIPAPYTGIGNAVPLYTYQAAVSLPSGAQKQVTLYVPFSSGSQGITQNLNIDLLDNNGQKVSTQSTTLRSLGPNDIFIGVLSDQSTGFGPLSQLSLPSQSASTIVEQLSAATMPTTAAVLENFNLIVLDNFTTSTLNKVQLTALENWVNQGGTLIAVGGPEWHRTLVPLPADLLPVNVTGIDNLAAGTHLLPLGGPGRGGPDQNKASDTVQASVVASTATVAPGGTVILSAGTTPLIVQAQHGEGQICYLAFDPSLEPIVGWPNANTLWKALLLRTMGDQLLSTGLNPGVPGGAKSGASNNTAASMEGLLRSLFPSAFPSTWLLLVLLLGYVAVLGPLRLLMIRLFKRRDWSWRIVLSTIVVFSLLSYGLAIKQKGTSIISSSISVIQLDRPYQAGTTAHVTTYVGVFVPSQGDFRVHIAGNNLVQPTTSQSRLYNGIATPEQTTVTSVADGTDVDLQGVDIWTTRSLVSKHDSQVQGGIVSHLVLQNGTLTGTVTNTLPYGLSDTYVLISDQYVSLGHLAAGQTRSVNLTLDTTPANPNYNQPMSLADQIAASHGLQTPYGPYSYYGNSQTLTDFQRHMAMLASVSGEYTTYYCGNGPCFQPARGVTYSGPIVINGNVQHIVFSGGPSNQGDDHDSLLISGAPATLIGWADRPPDSSSQVTINGTTPGGVQDAMVKAPLDISFSGAVTLPPDLVEGQLVDVQNQSGGSVQMNFAGVYTMTTGSMTFEFTLPGIPKLKTSSITITESSNMMKSIAYGPSGGTIGDVNHIHTYLYNWRTHSWDAFTFNQYVLSINNAQDYIDTGGRILMQFANPDNTLGTTILTRPSLQLQGTVAQ